MVLSNTNRYVIGKNFESALRVLAWEIVKKAVLFCTSDLLCKTVIVHISFIHSVFDLMGWIEFMKCDLIQKMYLIYFREVLPRYWNC